MNSFKEADIKYMMRKSDMPRVHAVVVTYNRKELLQECIEAILKQTVDVEKIIIVDNNR